MFTSVQKAIYSSSKDDRLEVADLVLSSAAVDMSIRGFNKRAWFLHFNVAPTALAAILSMLPCTARDYMTIAVVLNSIPCEHKNP